mgnify:CR=1 FL=1
MTPNLARVPLELQAMSIWFDGWVAHGLPIHPMANSKIETLASLREALTAVRLIPVTDETVSARGLAIRELEAAWETLMQS